MEIDPVCKMEVDRDHAEGVSEYKGKKYYFCSTSCKYTFDRDPEKYVGQVPPGAQPH